MAWTVLTSCMLLNPVTREIIPVSHFYLFLVFLGEMYAFFVIGYTFPGQTFVYSKNIRNSWKQNLGKRGYKGKQQLAKSCGDIKVRFGSVNYYGRLTALIVLQFVIEKSLKLVLLMK